MTVFKKVISPIIIVDYVISMVRCNYSPIRHCELMIDDPFEMGIPNYTKINNQNKIAKLPKTIRLKNGQTVYLK